MIYYIDFKNAGFSLYSFTINSPNKVFAQANQERGSLEAFFIENIMHKTIILTVKTITHHHHHHHHHHRLIALPLALFFLFPHHI